MIAELIGQGTTRALLAAFNHVLTQHQWARDKLAMHAGRSVLVGLDATNLPKLPFLPPPEIRAVVSAQGLLEEVKLSPEQAKSEAAQQKPSVEMHIKPGFEAMSTFSREGPQGLLRHMKIEGDVLLAAALGEIASQARWDFEDDLSRFVGDVPARRIGQFVTDSKFAAQDGLQVVKGRLGVFQAQSGFPLADRHSLASLDQKIEALSKRLEAREKLL